MHALAIAHAAHASNSLSQPMAARWWIFGALIAIAVAGFIARRRA